MKKSVYKKVNEDDIQTKFNGKYIVIVDGQNDKKIVNALSKVINAKNIVVNYDSIFAYCDEYLDILDCIKELCNIEVLDKFNKLSIKIVNKKLNGLVNDSLHEELDTNEIENLKNVEEIEDDEDKVDDSEIFGDFITDFTFTSDNEGEVDIPEEVAAKLHVKYLKNHGLQVEIKPGRYSTKYYIHYQGQQQLDDLVKWCAWHFGESETIGNMPGTKLYNTMIKYIISGKKCIF